jgi:hypothetical protein
VVVLPEKGAEIYAFHYKPKDFDPLLRLRGGLRTPGNHPATIPNSDGAFLDSYSGGWQELFPSGGGPSNVLGAELGRHGEVALLPWDWEISEDKPGCVSVKFWTRTVRMPFILERLMSLNSNQAVLNFDEVVTNEGGEELPYMWGHHPVFGEPFLGQSCILDVPASEVVVHSGDILPGNRLPPGEEGTWPFMKGINGDLIDLRKIPTPNEGSLDMFYLTGLKQGWYALINRNLGIGVAYVWDKDIFPVIWVWNEFGGSTGYPWYSRTNALGLEPFSSYAITGSSGLAEVIRAGRENRLPPGGKSNAWLKAIIFPATDAKGVEDVTINGEVQLRK